MSVKIAKDTNEMTERGFRFSREGAKTQGAERRRGEDLGGRHGQPIGSELLFGCP